MIEPADILGFVAVILLVAAGGLWVTPKLQGLRTFRRPAPTRADGTPPAALLLLAALGVSALAAVVAVIGLIM